jgi:hypothetical protein
MRLCVLSARRPRVPNEHAVYVWGWRAAGAPWLMVAPLIVYSFVAMTISICVWLFGPRCSITILGPSLAVVQMYYLIIPLFQPVHQVCALSTVFTRSCSISVCVRSPGSVCGDMHSLMPAACCRNRLEAQLLTLRQCPSQTLSRCSSHVPLWRPSPLDVVYLPSKTMWYDFCL